MQRLASARKYLSDIAEFKLMVSRREALRIANTGLVLGLAGCVGNQASESTDSPTPLQSPTASTEPFDPLDYVDEWHEEPLRAEGEPIEVEKTLDSSEPLDTACNSLATDTVRDRVKEQLDDPGRLSGGRGRIDHPDFETAVYIHRQFIIKRDGTVRFRPKVSFDTLLEVTPRTIRATVRYEDEANSCEFPVFLEDEVWYEE